MGEKYTDSWHFTEVAILGLVRKGQKEALSSLITIVSQIKHKHRQHNNHVSQHQGYF